MTEDKKDDMAKTLNKIGEDMGFEVMEGKEAIDFINEEMNKPEHVKAIKENAEYTDKLLKTFFAKDHKYKWQPGMGEISGMGGSYEQGCRAMLIAGLEYLDDHPNLDPRFKGWKGAYGVLVDDNEDAKKLDKAVLDAVDRECTGAMHHAAIETILWIRHNGWKRFVDSMREARARQ